MLDKIKKIIEEEIRFVLNEEVPVTFRNITKYFQIYIKKVSDLRKNITKLNTQLNQLLESNEETKDDKEYLFGKLGIDYSYFQYFLKKSMDETPTYGIAIVDFLNEAEALLAAIKQGHHSSIPRLLSHMLKVIEEYSGLEFISSVEYLSENFYSDMKDLEDLEDQFGPIVHQVDQLVDEIFRSLNHIIAIFKQTAKRINARFLLVNRRREDLPPTDNVEILYHATVEVEHLLKHGFDKDGPKSVKGLGGSQFDKNQKPATSFTSDLFVANQVAKCLKEAIMIARGELTLSNLISAAKADGVYERVWNYIKLDHKDHAKHGPRWQAWKFYLAYLSLGERYNPLFFNIWPEHLEYWATKTTKDVGVLVCKVDMTVDGILFDAAMDEFRVPSSAILSIEKVIR